MITVFSTPKPFVRNGLASQYNAIGSWRVLHPDAQVILVGNEEGTAQAAKDLGVEHIAEVDQNRFGTPLVSAIFEKARQIAVHDIICYVNADIILTSGFTKAVNMVHQWASRFLIVGRRWNVDFTDVINFRNGDWEQEAIRFARANGKSATDWQIDFFVFPKSEYRDVPPFAIGRVRWDNWMIWRARATGIPVVNATALMPAIHQNHDYSHHPDGSRGVWEGPEAVENMELAGGWDHIFSIRDADYRLIKWGTSIPVVRNPTCLIPGAARFLTKRSRLFRLVMKVKRLFSLVLGGQWKTIHEKIRKTLPHGTGNDGIQR
jgi:hypothetical protein